VTKAPRCKLIHRCHIRYINTFYINAPNCRAVLESRFIRAWDGSGQFSQSRSVCDQAGAMQTRPAFTMRLATHNKLVEFEI
jgi:hypothetical protein